MCMNNYKIVMDVGYRVFVYQCNGITNKNL